MSASAQETSRQRAEAAFDEGTTHYQDHRYLLAAESFRQSYEILRAADDPDAGLILYNVATSLDEVAGHEREAREAYARFLAEAPPSDAETRGRMATVQARIRELDARLADETGSGEEIERAAATDAAEPTSSAENQVSLVGPILMGVGGAVAIVGAVFGGLALANGDTLQASCGGETCSDTPEHRSTHDEMTLFAGLSDGLIAGGAALAVVGLVLTFTLETAGDTVEVATTCISDGCAAVVRGTF